jgi:hypothetical protein
MHFSNISFLHLILNKEEENCRKYKTKFHLLPSVKYDTDFPETDKFLTALGGDLTLNCTEIFQEMP